MDFKQDLIEIAKDGLVEMGIKNSVSDEDVLYYYIDRMSRFIDHNVSYIIKHSNEFSNNFAILTKQQQSGIMEIERRLMNREPITDFLSKTLFWDVHKNIDTLLKNWNIHHAHLSDEKDTRSGRSSHLLFFIQEQETIYFIDILKHPEKNNFFKRELLEVVYNNWPYLVRKIPGATKVLKPLNDREIHEESSKKVILVQLGDKVLMPTSLGVTASGISIQTYRTVSYILEMLDKWQDHFQNNMMQLLEDIRKQTSIDLDMPLQLTLTIENNLFIAYDENYQIKIPMFYDP